MKFYIEEMPFYRIAYIRRLGAYGAENVLIMEKLKTWAKSSGLYDENSIILAIPHDNPQTVKAEDCRYDACITISDNYSITDENDVSDGKVAGGRYAVFRVEHTAEGLQEAWTDIFPELERKNVFLDISKPIIERYQVKMVNNHFCEICVPVL